MRAAIVNVIVVVGQEKNFSASHEVHYTVRVRRTMFKKMSPVEWTNPLDQINPIGLVRRTRVAREAEDDEDVSEDGWKRVGEVVWLKGCR